MKTIDIFKPNHAYRIYPSGYKSAPSEYFGGTVWEKNCVFVFLRKEGKHHFFRELKGGWTRTYTDNQLIGKKIQEVNYEGKNA